MKVIGVNGMSRLFKASTGAETTDRLLASLALRHQVRTHDFNYPPVRFYHTRRRARQHAYASGLADAADDGDAVVAHSFGCLIALRAMELGAKFGPVFLFRPAMNRDFVWPILGATRIHIIYCHSDEALWAGRLLLWHPIGSLGRLGYGGPPDPRIVQHRIVIPPPNHVADFRGGRVNAWADFIAAELGPEYRMVSNETTRVEVLDDK